MARRARRGGNAVEFALLAPVLFGLLTGIMDYGWVSAIRFAAGSAAREGARAGALTPRDESPEAVATAAAEARWASVGLPGTPTVAVVRGGTPEVLQVQVEVDVASLVGLVVGPSVHRSTSTQRMEEQP